MTQAQTAGLLYEAALKKAVNGLRRIAEYKDSDSMTTIDGLDMADIAHTTLKEIGFEP